MGSPLGVLATIEEVGVSERPLSAAAFLEVGSSLLHTIEFGSPPVVRIDCGFQGRLHVSGWSAWSAAVVVVARRVAICLEVRLSNSHLSSWVETWEEVDPGEIHRWAIVTGQEELLLTWSWTLRNTPLGFFSSPRELPSRASVVTSGPKYYLRVESSQCCKLGSCYRSEPSPPRQHPFIPVGGRLRRRRWCRLGGRVNLPRPSRLALDLHGGVQQELESSGRCCRRSHCCCHVFVPPRVVLRLGL